MTTSEMKRCVVFDMDGTLANTTKITVPACINAAREYGITPPTDSAVMAAIGIGGHDFYRKLFPDVDEAALPALAGRIFELEKEKSRELGADLLFPEVAGLLASLAQQGIAMAIASTGDIAHVDNVLTVTCIKHLFAEIKCNTNDKTGQLKALKEIFKGYDMWMVGDKPKDSDAARANGIPSIGVGYGFSTAAELAGFDTVANSVTEIYIILGVCND